MAERLRIGILGTGNIARQFAVGVNASRRCSLAAVGSRAAATAQAFASAHAIPAAYGAYDALLADRSVEAVYVSLPNSLHHEWTTKALRAGKHVLCEKPLASDAAESQEMFDAARRAGRTLVEAFMYRSHPQTLAVVQALRSGIIGQLKLIRTSFCYRTTRIADNIRFSAELAGGSLMDVGCYCISFSRLVAGGEPLSMCAWGHRHESGVDDSVAGVLGFAEGVAASFTCGMSVQADNAAYLCGTEGYIQVPVPWKPPAQRAEHIVAHSTPPRQDGPVKGPPPRQSVLIDAGMDLYGLEADDFAATVQDGAPARVSEPDTMGNMRVLDELRRQLREQNA